MKYKKYSYILVLILMLMVGINRTYADEEKTCNYLSSNNEAAARLTIKWGYDAAWLHGGKDYTMVQVQKLESKIDNDSEEILNWYSNFNDSGFIGINNVTGITLSAIYNGSSEANKNPSCPKYLILRTTTSYSNYGAFATNSKLEAEKFVNASNQVSGYKAWYLTHTTTDNSSNVIEISDEEYFRKAFGFVQLDPMVDFDAQLECSDLFGDEDDETSIAYLVNSILKYVRIIVPILVIVLGILDLAKAVIASKEDEMKKAQTTFIKRIVIGVAVFFVPLLVNVIMDFADIVWEGMGYTICEFK